MRPHQRFHARLTAFSQGDGEQILLHEPLFGPILYPLAEALFLSCATQAERFFSELPLFLRRYGLDAGMQGELVAWQRLMAVLPEPKQGKRHDFQWDWHRFFEEYYLGSPGPLQAKANTLVFPRPQASYAWPDFAREFVWYGRRTGYLIRKDYEINYA
jgi:hypothetical protein